GAWGRRCGTETDITFAPKITAGKAGSGLHVHMRLMDAQGNSVMLDPESTTGRLSDQARTAIAGIMDLAPALTAFGNTNPTSYFRLVPHQEAPTNICWGDRNRSVLVRVPLGWSTGGDMCAVANGAKACDAVAADPLYSAKQTFEIRSADGSADIYMLLAGLAVAVRHGFEMANPLEVAERYYVDVDIHKPENAARLAALPTLPASCAASADALEAVEGIFEEYGVFSKAMLDGVTAKLRSYTPDRTDEALADKAVMLEMVRRYFYCG
ncbi:MAG: glutamine synthetase, partial [Muribaculaceae bacterium]|nr:glutamine synthetase [Muribaculaceae bacterium]